MKDVFLNIYRCIVGPEYGFTAEGNEQWYYSLAIVMNLMLLWWLKPEIALLFTILAIIHYLTVAIYGYFDLECGSVIFSYTYLGIHLILLIIAIFTSFKWSIITVTITTVALFLAPDCVGNNIFSRKPHVYNQLLYADNQRPLLYNTIIFVAFIVIDFLLPIKFWIKLSILMGALIIHPAIDFIQGECVVISDVTWDVVIKIKEVRDSKKNH